MKGKIIPSFKQNFSRNNQTKINVTNHIDAIKEKEFNIPLVMNQGTKHAKDEKNLSRCRWDKKHTIEANFRDKSLNNDGNYEIKCMYLMKARESVQSCQRKWQKGLVK